MIRGRDQRELNFEVTVSRVRETSRPAVMIGFGLIILALREHSWSFCEVQFAEPKASAQN